MTRHSNPDSEGWRDPIYSVRLVELDGGIRVATPSQAAINAADEAALAARARLNGTGQARPTSQEGGGSHE